MCGCLDICNITCKRVGAFVTSFLSITHSWRHTIQFRRLWTSAVVSSTANEKCNSRNVSCFFPLCLEHTGEFFFSSPLPSESPCPPPTHTLTQVIQQRSAVRRSDTSHFTLPPTRALYNMLQNANTKDVKTHKKIFLQLLSIFGIQLVYDIL